MSKKTGAEHDLPCDKISDPYATPVRSSSSDSSYFFRIKEAIECVFPPVLGKIILDYLGYLGYLGNLYSVVSTKYIPASASNNSKFLGLGFPAVDTLTIDKDLEVGAEVILGSVRFTAVNNPTEEGQFKLGVSTQGTAQNLATAIITHSSKALQFYKISVIDDIVYITQISTSGMGISLIPSAYMIGRIVSMGASGGIDVSGIKTMSDFIGPLVTANFSLVDQHTGSHAGHIAYANGNSLAEGHNNYTSESTAVYQLTINGTVFQGAFFQANGSNLARAKLKMIDNVTGQYFIINADHHYAGSVDTPSHAFAVATDLNTLWQGTTFQQTGTLSINTEGGDILNDTGSIVGNVTGMAARLTTTDFTNLKFRSFTIMPSTKNTGGIKFIATFNNVLQYILDDTEANIARYVQGYRLDLVRAKTGDTLSINIGYGGLTALADPKNITPIALAIQKALMNVYKDDEEIRGTESDKATVIVPDIGISDALYSREKDHTETTTIDLAGSDAQEESL